jgi:hypothetical protein
VSVPNETDFIMVRCVLLGAGTAWFDEVVAERASSKKAEDDEKPGAKDAVEKSDKGPDKRRETEEVDPSPTLEELRASRQALMDANRALRDLNNALSAQVMALRTEVQSLRKELQRMRTAPAPAAPRRPAPPAPPLVPHGRGWNEETP